MQISSVMYPMLIDRLVRYDHRRLRQARNLAVWSRRIGRIDLKGDGRCCTSLERPDEI
ncbi:hypothetical protein PAE2_9 [Pseudomonas phage PAE2]|nr:hypothetical protein PAE2_9 [Pseudomonas phage PAE2]